MNNKGAVKESRVRKFQTSWLEEDNFKGWLAPHPTDNKALCILYVSYVCAIELSHALERI